VIKKPETITITVDEDGVAVVSVSGVAGTGCVALTADLLSALGGTAHEQKTEEYHRVTVTAGNLQTVGQ